MANLMAELNEAREELRAERELTSRLLRRLSQAGIVDDGTWFAGLSQKSTVLARSDNAPAGMSGKLSASVERAPAQPAEPSDIDPLEARLQTAGWRRIEP